MKTIYLFRHSAPDRQSKVANSQIPLTADGKAAAARFWSKIKPSEAVAVYSSPYRRAYETAEAMSQSIITDERLIERETGERSTFTPCRHGRGNMPTVTLPTRAANPSAPFVRG